MKLFKSLLLTFAIVFLYSANVSASHVSGGNITYVPTGNPNEFLVTLTLYRDCGGIAAPAAPPTINFWNDCDGTTLTLAVAQQSLSEVSQLCPQSLSQSECNGGSLPGIEEYQYVGVVILDPPCDSWHMSYSLNARNGSTNLNGGTFYVESSINTVVAATNTSPQITAQPIPYVCTNYPVSYNFGVIEPDGDSLAYSFTDPLNAQNTPIGFQGGYTFDQPIPGITLDPNTGQINFTPTMAGVYVLAVLIQEYNQYGILIGTIVQDIQFVVEDCINTPPVAPIAIGNFDNGGTNAAFDSLISPNTISMCSGDFFECTVTFTDINLIEDTLIITSNITDILPGATMTVSGINPATATLSWNYTSGYTNNVITVYVNDGACPVMGSNSYSILLNVPPPLNLSHDDSICGNQTAPIYASGQGPLTWSVLSGPPMVIGTNFSCNNCDNPIATPIATTTYLLEDNSICLLTDTVTIEVADNFGDIRSTIYTNDTVFCPGFCVDVSAHVEEDYTGKYTYPYTGNTDFVVGANGTVTSPQFILPGGGINPTGPGGMTTILTGSITEVCINVSMIGGTGSLNDLDIYLVAPTTGVIVPDFLLSEGNGSLVNPTYTNTCFVPSTFTGLPYPTNINSGSAFSPFTGNYFPQSPGNLEDAGVGADVQGLWGLKIVNNGSGAAVIDSWSMKLEEPFSNPVQAAYFAWDNQDGMPATPSIDPTVCPTVGGQYILTAYNIDYCWINDTINIDLLPLPNPGMDTSVQICKEAGMVDLFTYVGGTPDVVGSWRDSSGAVINPVLNANTILDNAPYLYIAESPGGCYDTSYLNIDVIEITGNTIGVDSDCMACNGSIEVIVAGGVGAYTYSNTTVAGPGLPSNLFNNICGAGNYDILIEDAIGCQLTLTQSVVDINFPAITDTVVIAPSCFSFCDGEIAVIGQNLTSYSLDGAPPVPSSLFTGLCDGVYDITAYSGPNGLYCSVQLTGVVITEPIDINIQSLTANLIPINFPITNPLQEIGLCKENDLELNITGVTGDNTLTYNWFNNNNNIGSGANWTTSVTTPGDVCAVLTQTTNANCLADTACFTIDYFDDIYPAFTHIGESKDCYKGTDGNGYEVGLINQSNNVADIGSITWTFSNGHVVSTNNYNLVNNIPSEYVFSEAGLYDVTMEVTSVNSCVFDTTYYGYFEAYGYPKLNFTPNPVEMTIYEPTSTMVNLSSAEAVGFKWNFGSSGVSPNVDEANPTVEYPEAEPGRYRVQMIGWNVHDDGKQCYDTIYGEVRIVNDVLIFAPNSFTPDGNNYNENWRVHISGIDIYEFELTMFNRYGEIVWKSYDSNGEWDGTYGKDGQPVQDGTYPWVITAKDALDDRKYEFRGTVNIVR